MPASSSRVCTSFPAITTIDSSRSSRLAWSVPPDISILMPMFVSNNSWQPAPRQMLRQMLMPAPLSLMSLIRHYYATRHRDTLMAAKAAGYCCHATPQYIDIVDIITPPPLLMRRPPRHCRHVTYNRHLFSLYDCRRLILIASH